MTDLVTLSEQLKKFDLENGLDLALKMRKAKRFRRSQAARKGWAHRRSADCVLLASLPEPPVTRRLGPAGDARLARGDA